jgi:hypothetical protein
VRTHGICCVNMIDISDLQAGKAGEYLVCADLILQGCVAFPSEQGLPFDVVADADGRLVKIQVKTTRAMRAIPQRVAHQAGYLFNIKRTGKGGKRTYRSQDVDVFALVSLDSREIGYLAARDVRQTMIFRSPRIEGQYLNERLAPRTARAKELRGLGWTFDKIGKELKIDRSMAHRLCKGTSGKERLGRYLRDFSFHAALIRARDAAHDLAN